MKHEKIEGSAPNAAPGVLLDGEQETLSAKAPKSPPSTRIPPMPEAGSDATVTDWRMMLVEQGYFERVDVVTGDLGPIHVIDSPRVVVAVRRGSTWVWAERQPWAWPDTTKEFLNSPSKAALRYAVDLATRLRNEAQREFDRRERVKGAHLAELAARIEGRKQ